MTRLVGHYAWVLAAYVLACLMASAAFVGFALASLTPQNVNLTPLLSEYANLVFDTALVFLVAGIIPMLAIIILAETLSIQSIVFYALAGTMVALAAALGMSYVDPASYQAPTRYGTITAGAAGFMAGLVYWLVAGRNAGVTIRRRTYSYRRAED